jgi:alcohol dehydrogenase
VQHAELPATLGEMGIDSATLPQLAADAAKQWTGSFNPRRVSEAELLSIYEKAF